MYSELDKFILENTEDVNFIGGVEENKIKDIEVKLNVNLPESYKNFLRKYGYGAAYGREVLGCGKSEVPSVVAETLRFRKLGLPEEYVVIQNCDEWIYCLDTGNMKNEECPVISWDRNEGFDSIEGKDFNSFILEQFNEAKEDW